MLDSILDNPISAYALLVAAELVIAGLWWNRRSGTLRWLMAVPLVLAAALAVTGHFVITDRQQISRALCQAARDVEQGQFDRFAQVLDDSFHGRVEDRDVDRKLLVEAVRAGATALGVSEIRLPRILVEFNGPTARVHVVSYVKYKDAQTPLVWDLVCIKRNGQWRVLELEKVQNKVEL